MTGKACQTLVILFFYQQLKPGKQIIRAGHYPSRGLVKAKTLLTCNPQSVKVQRRPRKARGGLAQRAATFRLSDPVGMTESKDTGYQTTNCTGATVRNEPVHRDVRISYARLIP